MSWENLAVGLLYIYCCMNLAVYHYVCMNILVYNSALCHSMSGSQLILVLSKFLLFEAFM